MPKSIYTCYRCGKEIKRWSSQVPNSHRIFCSRACQATVNTGGVKNPNYKHGHYASEVLNHTRCPSCGEFKDPRAKQCSNCSGRGFPIGYRNKENPQASETSRKRLFRSDTLYICSKCGLEPLWNGEPLTLHMDHISGDRKNNREENLRWLCPNCHSQTKTFAQKKEEKSSSVGIGLSLTSTN